MASKYTQCPCGGRIPLTQLINYNHGTFVKCDSCKEEFPLDEDGFPNADVMIGKVKRIERYHKGVLDHLKSTMRYWEAQKYGT